MTTNQAFRWRYGELEDKNFEIHGHNLLVLLLILSAILLFSLIFLYVRWACRAISSGDTHQTATPASRSQMQPSGLDAATIKSFPVVIHQADDQSSAADESQCSICLANLVNGEKVKVMPSCSHAFHPECVDQWLQAHPSCPLCRASLVGDGEPANKAEAMV